MALTVEQIRNSPILGKGSYGKVYKVEYNNQYIAVKEFLNSGDDISEDAVIEIDILNRCNHPNIIKPLFTEIINDTTFIGLPLASTDLWKKSNSGYIFNNVEKVDIMYSLLCGVSYLHDNYIIHSDLKPNNILIFGITYKIADFGSAIILPFSPESNSKVKYADDIVTLYWRAPEIILEMDYNYAIDIWSLGIIFE